MNNATVEEKLSASILKAIQAYDKECTEANDQ